MQFFVKRIIIGLVFIVVLIGIIGLARGYRFDLDNKTIEPTGILVASSSPDGGKIYINGELKGATNSNITLQPGTYEIDIKKEGYVSWEKSITIKRELIIKIEALLFPQNPSLSPITSLGITKASSSLSTDKIILFSESGDPEKDGIYLFENTRNPLSIINPLKLLILKSAFPSSLSFADSFTEFSPDEKEFMLSFTAMGSKEPYAVYLITTEGQTETPFNVTQSVKAIRSAWQEESADILEKKLETFEEPLLKIATQSFNILTFSPDEEKILYSSKEDISIPLIIKPRIVSSNQSEERRDLKKGNLYVYDKKEDINFQVAEAKDLENIKSDLNYYYSWYPDSKHIVIKLEDGIDIIDHDGSNKRTVYSGPFEQNFLSTSKDGKLFTLINLNVKKGGLPDMYAIGIR